MRFGSGRDTPSTAPETDFGSTQRQDCVKQIELRQSRDAATGRVCTSTFSTHTPPACLALSRAAPRCAALPARLTHRPHLAPRPHSSSPVMDRARSASGRRPRLYSSMGRRSCLTPNVVHLPPHGSPP